MCKSASLNPVALRSGIQDATPARSIWKTRCPVVWWSGIPSGSGQASSNCRSSLAKVRLAGLCWKGRGAIYNSREEVLAVIGEASPDTYKHFQEASDGPRAPCMPRRRPL